MPFAQEETISFDAEEPLGPGSPRSSRLTTRMAAAGLHTASV
jgi:hypothetical protein